MDDIVLIHNDRDRRTLNWLIEKVGEDAIRQAVCQLAGDRKPYLSNIAKVLDVELPKKLSVTPQLSAQAYLCEIKKLVGINNV